MAPLWMSRSYRFFRPRFTVGLGMKHHVKVRTDPQVHPWIWGQKSQIYGVSTSFHASIEDIEGLHVKYKRGMSMHGWRQDSRIANYYRLHFGVPEEQELEPHQTETPPQEHQDHETTAADDTSAEAHPPQQTPTGVSLAWYPRSRLWVQRPSPGSPSKCWLRLIVHWVVITRNSFLWNNQQPTPSLMVMTPISPKIMILKPQ